MSVDIKMMPPVIDGSIPKNDEIAFTKHSG